MKFATIIVTRSKSCHVKTLHSILKFNLMCLQNNCENEIVFVNDDPFYKADTIAKYIKTHERLLFIDFGIQIDDDSLRKCFDKLVGDIGFISRKPIYLFFCSDTILFYLLKSKVEFNAVKFVIIYYYCYGSNFAS